MKAYFICARKAALAGERVTVKILSVVVGYEFRCWEIENYLGTCESEFTFVLPPRENCRSLGSGNAKSTGNYEPYANKFCAYVGSGSSTGCYSSVTYTEAFFTSTLGFSSSVWDLSHVAEGKLPTLIQN